MRGLRELELRGARIARGACLHDGVEGAVDADVERRRDAAAEARDRRLLVLVGPRDELADDAEAEHLGVAAVVLELGAREERGEVGGARDPRLGVEGVGAQPREQQLGEGLGERGAARAREEVEELRAPTLVRVEERREERALQRVEQRVLVLVRRLRHRRRRRRLLRLRAAAAADLPRELEGDHLE